MRPGETRRFRQSDCPSEFALERLRFGELAASPQEAGLLAHVDRCSGCRRLLAELASSPLPPAPAMHRVMRRARRVPWWRASFAAAGLAAAALALVVGRRPPLDNVTKGADWQWTVIARRADGVVRAVQPGEALAAGDRLRFQVFTRWRRGHVVLVMLDDAGVSPLVPPSGASLPVTGGRQTLLDGAVELDGAPGAERIVLAACDESTTVDAVLRAAKRAFDAAGDASRVGSLGTGCHEESFWIAKARR
jgi:hypothetical protein